MPEAYIWSTPPMCGGVNNSLPDVLIEDAELADCSNYVPDLTGRGWLIKREGISKQDTNQRTATTYSVFSGIGNYYHNGTVVYNFSGTSLATGLAAAFDSWSSYNGRDWVVNGTDRKYTTDGTNFSDDTAIPSGAKYLAASNGFLYVAGHDKGKLRYSSYGLNTFPASNELVLTADERDDIIGLLPVKNGVAVFCTKSFYVISGWTDIDQQVGYYDKSIGALSNRSLVNTPFGMFFWSRAGIAWAKEGYQIDFPMIRKLAATLAGLNRAQDANVHAVFDSLQGRVSFFCFNGAAQATVNLRIDYYPMRDAFFLQSGAAANMSAAAAVIVSGVENIYCGGYNPTYLYKVNGTVGTDDGTTVSSYAETKREGFPLFKRNGRSIVLTTDLTAQADVTYGCYQDHASSLTQTFTNTIATGGVDTVILTNQQNRRLKHRIADSATTRTRIIQLTHAGTANKEI